MSYAQFGYPYHPASQLLMSGQSPGSSSVAPNPCCESGGRTLVTDPVTGQTVFACQQCDSHSAATLMYPRLSASGGATNGVAGGQPPPSTTAGPPSYVSYSTSANVANATMATDQYPPPVAMDSSTFYTSLGAPYVLKDGSADVSGWQSMAQPTGYYPYDPSLAAYGYGYDLNGARRKNATREATATLKAWLNEHKKNPYPTKGEKIMLAIITKMTLTQVSTWFANARRRLKKDNKITWDTKGKDDDEADDEDDEDVGKSSDDEHHQKDNHNHNNHHHPRTTSDKQGSHNVPPTSSKSAGNSGLSVYDRPNELKTFGQDVLRSCDGGSGGSGVINPAAGVDVAAVHPTLRPTHQMLLHRLPCSPSVSSSPATSPSSSASSSNVPIVAGVHGGSHLLAPSSASCYSTSTLQELQRNSASKVMCGSNDVVASLMVAGVGNNPHPLGMKPKIWSLADTATCKTPPTLGGYNTAAGFGGGGAGVEWTSPFSNGSGSVQRTTAMQGSSTLPPVPPFQVTGSSASTSGSPVYRNHFPLGGAYQHHHPPPPPPPHQHQHQHQRQHQHQLHQHQQQVGLGGSMAMLHHHLGHQDHNKSSEQLLPLSHVTGCEPQPPPSTGRLLPGASSGSSSSSAGSSAAFSTELQTDTPPQTPPNHKFPTVTNYGVVVAGVGGNGGTGGVQGSGTAGYNCAPEVYGGPGSGSGGAGVGGSSARTLLSVNSRLHDFQDDDTDIGYGDNQHQSINNSSSNNNNNGQATGGVTAFKPVYKSALSNNDNLVIV